MNIASASRKAQAAVHDIRRRNSKATDFEIQKLMLEDETLKEIGIPDGNITEDWLCVDCGINTAPGIPDGLTCIREIERTGGCDHTIDDRSEVYMVRNAVWKKAGSEDACASGALKNALAES
jgi:hypothetical protein